METQYLLYIALGFGVGVLSGIVGLGGGIVMIPALLLLFHFSQHQAQGTTLAMMVPPIGLLAAWSYYKQGYVDIKVAGLCAVGFFIGGFFGAKIAVGLSDVVMRKVFGGVLMVFALKMVFWR